MSQGNLCIELRFSIILGICDILLLFPSICVSRENKNTPWAEARKGNDNVEGQQGCRLA